MEIHNSRTLTHIPKPDNDIDQGTRLQGSPEYRASVEHTNETIPSLPQDLEIPDHVLDFSSKSEPQPQPERGKSKISVGIRRVRKKLPGEKYVPVERRKVVRKLMSGIDVPESPEYGRSVKLFGRREQGASLIAQALKLQDYPRIRVKKEASHEDPLRNQSFIESSFVDGSPLFDHPALVDHLKKNPKEDSAAIVAALRTLDHRSLHQATLFNWLIGHRDSHLGNFLTTKDNKLVPIDYGMSMDKDVDEESIPERACPISTQLWKRYPNAIIPKDMLKNIAHNRSRILNIVREHILPHYSEGKREQVLETFKNKINRVIEFARSGKRVRVSDFYPREYRVKRDPAFGANVTGVTKMNLNKIHKYEVKYGDEVIGQIHLSAKGEASCNVPKDKPENKQRLERLFLIKDSNESPQEFLENMHKKPYKGYIHVNKL